MCPVQGAQQSLPNTVTISQLLQLLKDRSPRMAVARNKIELAAADIAGAKVLPNPRVNYNRNDKIAGNQSAQFDGHQLQTSTVDIPLLIAGQRQVRIEAAERGVKAAEADVNANYADLAHQTWLIFAQLLANEERVKVLQDELQHLEKIKKIITGRSASGAASQYEVLRIDVEGTSLETQLADAHAAVTGSAGEIGSLLQFPNWFPHGTGHLAPLGVSINLDELREKIEQRNPTIEAARKAEDAADANIVSAKRERWPTPIVSVGSVWTNSPYSNTSYIGLSVELPLFDRKQGQIARAQAQKQQALLSLQSLAAESRADLERAAEILTQRKATLAKFESEALSRLPSLERMAEDAYRFGKGGLLELLDATRARTEIKLSYLSLLEALVKAEVDALSASGLLVEKAASLQ
jgi:cobalt-zinc-cadmium efflux system outer membrane protein